jgi:branched-chain amino acid transport system permease protein
MNKTPMAQARPNSVHPAPQAAAKANYRPPARGPQRGIAIGIALAVLILLPFVITDKFILSLAVTTFITVITASSLHLIVRMGHVSLGHSAFVGIGAYLSAFAMMKLSLPFWAAICLAFAGPALLALLIGPVVLRLTGKYFVLVTFLFGEIIRTIFSNWTGLTGGSSGISGVPAPSPFFASPIPFYYLVLGFAVVIVAFIGRLLSCEMGRAIEAIRESESLANCSGIPVLRTKVMVFMLGCGIAGIGGALFGQFIQYIDPTSFSIVQSLNLVVINVIGGMFTLVGPIVGTLFVVLFPEFLRGYVELQYVFFGILLILAMAFFPGGIADMGSLVQKFRLRRKPLENRS